MAIILDHVQRNINHIFEFISHNLTELPKTEATRIQINNQIRQQFYGFL